MSALIRPLTAAEVAATAAIRFREQYKDWNDSDRFADGKTKADVQLVFNTQAHSPENVARILNKGWAYPQCTFCGDYFNAVAQLKDGWGDETANACRPCLERALIILDGQNTEPQP